MNIPHESKEETIKKLVKKSKELLLIIEKELEILDLDKFNFVLNRKVSDLYYCAFYLAEVLLLLRDITKIKKHSTVNYLLSKYYKEYSPMFSNLFRLRNKVDYSLDFTITRKEVEQLLKEVKEFYEKVLEYLKEREVLNEKEIEELKI
jgi:uncharacterized protein (UPF0332 family)